MGEALRGRRHPHDRDRPGRATTPGEQVVVIVAVDDELRAVAGQNRLDFGRVLETTEGPGLARERRVVNEHEAEESIAPEAVEEPGDTRELRLAQPAGGNERRRRYGRVDPDECDR